MHSIASMVERRMPVFSEPVSREDLLSSPPDWSSYVRAGGEQGLFLTDAHVDLIREYENQPDEGVQELLESEGNGEEYVSVLINIINNVTNPDALKYVLTLVEDFLIPNLPQRCVYFKAPTQPLTSDLLTGEPVPLPNSDTILFRIEPFMKCLSSQNAYVRDKSIHILALLFSLSPNPENVMCSFVDWLVAQLSDKTNSLPAAVRGLSILLRNQQCRAQFHRRGGVRILLGMTRSESGKLQLLYELGLCLWLMSFCPEAVGAFDHAALKDIVDLVKTKPREKVLRVALATLRGILDDEEREKTVSEALIDQGMIKVLQTMSSGRVEDEDLLEDINTILQKLNNNYRVLNTFERHQQELLTERLEWGTVHTEKFWRENARKFEMDDFASVRKLVALVSSDDPDTAAIACNDIGFFVQYYPNGKTIVDRMEGKKKVMMLLAHSNPEVQKQALLCCSKMMITNWEFLRLPK